MSINAQGRCGPARDRLVAANGSIPKRRMAREGPGWAGFALFKSLTETEIRGLEGEGFWRRFEPESRIFEYNDQSTEVYFVASGMVRVYLPTGRHTDVILADIGSGEFFGEM